MEPFRPTRSLPPDLPGAEASDRYIDYTLMLLLADETEAALRWAAAVVGRDSSLPGALIVTSRLLEQMGRTKAAIAGLGLALQNAVDAASVPLAIAAIDDLRALGIDVSGHLDRLATAFCQGSYRLDPTKTPATPPRREEVRPLSSFLTGPALASAATRIVEGVVAADEQYPRAERLLRVAPLPLFSALGMAALRDLLGAFEVITVGAGHSVLEQGTQGDAVYIVAHGELEVSRCPAPDKPPVGLARLGDGSFFGEMALLSELPVAASVVATRPSILLVARREALQKVAAQHPEVGVELAAHCREQLVANLGRVAPVLSTMPPAERNLLLERFETRSFAKGEKLISYGEEASGLHLVVSGEVAVVAREGGERVMLATLGAAETIGEIELVLCRRADADAIAVQPTVTLFLPREQFFPLAAEHPAILHGLYMAATQRNAEARLAMVAPSVLIDADTFDDALGSPPPSQEPATRRVHELTPQKPVATLQPPMLTLENQVATLPPPVPTLQKPGTTLPPLMPAPQKPGTTLQLQGPARQESLQPPPAQYASALMQTAPPPLRPGWPPPPLPPLVSTVSSMPTRGPSLSPPPSVAPTTAPLISVPPAPPGASRTAQVVRAVAMAAVAGAVLVAAIALPQHWHLSALAAGGPSFAPTPATTTLGTESVAVARVVAPSAGSAAAPAIVSRAATAPTTLSISTAAPPKTGAGARPRPIVPAGPAVSPGCGGCGGSAASAPQAAPVAQVAQVASSSASAAALAARAPAGAASSAASVPRASPEPATTTTPARDGQTSAQPASAHEDAERFGARD